MSSVRYLDSTAHEGEANLTSILCPRSPHLPRSPRDPSREERAGRVPLDQGVRPRRKQLVRWTDAIPQEFSALGGRTNLTVRWSGSNHRAIHKHLFAALHDPITVRVRGSFLNGGYINQQAHEGA